MNDPLRLLLLEDRPEDAELNTRALRMAGIAFTALRVDAPDAFTAALAEFKPDIILADYHLPGFDGLQALAIARDKSPDTPYIFVSGVIGEDFAVESIRQGATDYVLKDRLGRLPIAVRRALEEVKLRRQRREAVKRLREQSLFQASLLESIPVPVFYKDCEGRYLGCNRAYEETLGTNRSKIVGKTVREIAPTEIADRFHAKDMELLRRPGRQVYEWAIPKPSGELRNMVFHKATFLHSDGAVGGMIGVAIDVTELQRAKQALLESESRFRQLVENSPMCIHEIDMAGRITSMNKAGLLMMGVEDEKEVCGIPYLDAVSAGDRNYIADLLAKAYAGETSGFEFMSSAPGGQIFKSCFAPIKNENGDVIRLMGITENITEHKRVEAELQNYRQDLEEMVVERTAQLRTLAMELAMAEERERRAIAQDLHDDLSQTLAVVKLRLTSIKTPDRAEGNEDLMRQIREIESMVDRATRSVRSLSLQLSPPVLSQYGLVPALEWLAEEMQRAYHLRVRIDDNGKQTRLDETLSSSLFRTVRELLINVSKHAKVDAADVSVLADGDNLVITVTDTGVGFNVQEKLEPSAAGGYGLFSVRERLNSIGGDMQIDSRPGDGTVVVLTLPLDAMKGSPAQ